MVPRRIAAPTDLDAPRDRERNGRECPMTVAGGRKVGG
ncbi:hypothetical protein SAMN05443287_108276 [Micromonospora phaseoli]|uniref:Uncharacterized protein n=1 Tax=Micromonospora phaseoli TaxID=1144548 RepID=A0A1H7C4W0_9ACTN|nr:hypothetical protein CLV64_1108 [Micromonospora phaseoli]SEJ84809.1 hypothetical protein SAMN05443287_108276 [Micromonospora phaseoli]